MPIQVSICGLIAKPGVEPYAWETAFYWKELADPDPKAAAAFAEQEVRQEALTNGHPDARLLISTVHPLHIPRCAGIAFADIPVDGEDEVARYPNQTLHTVCGIYLDNGQTYSSYWMSYGPRMAYLDAWGDARDDGRTLLVTCVHEGQIDRYPDLDFADPSCDTEVEMKSLMQELVPTMVS